KDILATATFLTTGVLFFLAHLSGPLETGFSPDDGCGVEETIVVKETASEMPPDLLFVEPRSKDS
ncbi:MAG: hypothetical protein MUO50_14885, partial [Longimicrobiales bacterium]|nr:hypothetical protein [Longimicrobiales bacterium]